MLPDMFKPLEDDLLRQIREGDAPFLGVFANDFGKYVRKFLHGKIAGASYPFEMLVEGLREFPAIYASYLIIHVMEGFGQAGHFEVYPYIEEATTGTAFTQGQRERLWRHFRAACHLLGFPVSPRTSGAYYMVDEYLLQAGFPLQYVPELVKRMLRLANDAGLPDDDDPDSIALWQQSLVERLRMPFSGSNRRRCLG